MSAFFRHTRREPVALITVSLERPKLRECRAGEGAMARTKRNIEQVMRETHGKLEKRRRSEEERVDSFSCLSLSSPDDLT